VAGLFLLVLLPIVAGIAIAVLGPGGFELSYSLAENILTNLALVGGWLAAVAAYADGRKGTSLADVFA
jgi:hypothetical protein